MGEIENQLFCLSFDPGLKVDFQGSRVASDDGTLDVNDAWLSLYHPCRPPVAIQRGRRSFGGEVATILCRSQTVRDAQDVNPCTVCEHAQ